MERESMVFEIISAIHDSYQDESIEIDCLLWLSTLGSNDIRLLQTGAIAELCKQERCIECGTKLQTRQFREHHSEVGAYETLYDVYCPNCHNGGGV